MTNFRLLPPVFLAAALLGCHDKGAALPPPPAQNLWEQVNESFIAGKTNEVLRLLEQALADENYTYQRAGILRDLLAIRLSIGDVSAAQEKYLAVARENMAAAADAFGIIAYYLQQNGNHPALVEWCDTLLALDFPEPVRARLFGFKLEGLRGQDKFDELRDLLVLSAKNFPESQRAPVIQDVLDAMNNAGQFQELDRTLALIEQEFPDSPEFSQMVAITRFWALLKQAKIEEAGRLLHDGMDMLPEPAAAAALTGIARAAQEAGDSNLADDLCAVALAGRSVEGPLFMEASQLWIDLALAQGDARLVQRRLSILAERNAGVSHLATLTAVGFYLVAEKGDDDDRRNMLELCEQVYARAASDTQKTRAANLILDACFITGNFDRALKILELEKPHMEADEHAMLVPKVKAHKALADGDKPEAIRMFRKFMEHVKNAEEPFTDPSGGDKVSHDQILGLNAARIAEIWHSLGDKEKSDAAYQEARAHYLKALSGEKADSGKYAEIQNILNRLPKEEQ